MAEIVAEISRRREVEVFQNEYGSLYNDETTGPTGVKGRYLRWAWSRSGVIVVATKGDQVALWEMYRYPIRVLSLEFPRGGIELGEEPEDAAVRELKEETGLMAISAVKVGELYPDSGIIDGSTNVVHAEVAEEVSLATTESMESIGSTATWLDSSQISARIAGSAIRCSLTIAAWTIVSSRSHLGR